jgi:ankyrin repeat protein
MTALIVAAGNGQTPALQALLEARPDLELQADNGKTALGFAVSQGHAAIVKVLLGAGSRTEVKDNDGDLPLIQAARRGHTQVVAALLEGRAAVNARDSNGWTALMTAAMMGHVDIVDRLLRSKADTSVKEAGTGKTALILAAGFPAIIERARGEQTVQALILGGADVNAGDNEGFTALMAASTMGHGGVVPILLKAGADVNAATRNGRTALSYASAQGHTEVVRLLQAGGAKQEFEKVKADRSFPFSVENESNDYALARLEGEVTLEFPVSARSTQTVQIPVGVYTLKVRYGDAAPYRYARQASSIMLDPWRPIELARGGAATPIFDPSLPAPGMLAKLPQATPVAITAAEFRKD